MTVRLYTESDLKAVRNAEVVGERLDAAIAGYKALYRSLESIENEGNAGVLRIVRKEICDANYKLTDNVREVVRRELDRIIRSTAEVPGVDDVNVRIRGIKDDLCTEHPSSELKPCPICGAPHTWSDVRVDMDPLGGAHAILMCDCGYSFCADEVDIESDDGWRESFAELANRRAGA